MQLKTIITISALIMVFSCRNTANEPSSVVVKSPVDSLLDAITAGHDVAMRKMKKLERLQKEAEARLDSLKNSAHRTAGTTAYYRRLDSSFTELKNSRGMMNEWMQGFSYDSLKDSEPARIKYLQKQLEAVNQMKNAVLNSIHTADSLLLKRPE